MLTLILLLACAGETKTDDSAATTDDSAATTDDSAATTDDSAADDSGGGNGDTDTGEAPACATLNSGDDWNFNGECPMMRTPCDIVVDGCTLTIDYEADGGMTMGMPYEGTISGDTITFADGDYVTGCVGTIEDPDTVTGTCDDGCTFTLRR